MLEEISDTFEYIFASDEEAEVENLGFFWYPSKHLFPYLFQFKISYLTKKKILEHIYFSKLFYVD